MTVNDDGSIHLAISNYNLHLVDVELGICGETKEDIFIQFVTHKTLFKHNKYNGKGSSRSLSQVISHCLRTLACHNIIRWS